MITIGGEIVIRQSPEKVFDFLADWGNAPKWQTGVVTSEMISPGPMRPGTRFREVVQMGRRSVETLCEITELRQNEKVAFRAESPHVSYGGVFLFAPTNGGTRLTIEGWLRARGLLRLLEGAFAKESRSEIHEELERIKAAVEGRPLRDGSGRPVPSAAPS